MEAINQVIMYFQKGGLVMWPLLFSSLTVISISIERFLYYRNVGDAEYKEILLSKTDGVYTTKISKDKLSIDGFEYYVVISDGTNTITLSEDSSKPYKIEITNRRL